MQTERLIFLSRLSVFLNSSMSVKKVVEITIERLREALEVEAVTIFLRDEQSNELVFWALQGGGKEELEGTRMPLQKGVVGWVIENKQAALVEDAANDKRFFTDVDKESNFKTRNMLCSPLLVRGTHAIGAIQCLNKVGNALFQEEDLEFLDQCAHQVSLAIHNSMLFEKLERENKKLQRLDERKTEMLSVIGHEIKTPLTIIQGSAEVIAMQGQASAESLCKSLMKGVSRLTDLAVEIRNVSFVTDRKLTVDMQPCSISELCSDLLEKFKTPLETRKLAFELVNTNPEQKVICDEGLIFLTLKNLISNAIRFTPDGGRITLSISSSKGLVEFSLKDSGIGIAETEIPLIFEKFYEVGSAAHHSSGTYEFRSAGLGLGLASAKAILEAHGSVLRVESEPGVGSEFSFCLSAV